MTESSLSPLKEAFLALQDAQERIVALEAEKHEPIAVVGLGCRVPGVSDCGPEGFWTLLAQGRDTVAPALEQRWRELGVEADDVPECARYAALLERYDEFDAEFFGISPREAAGMDPQQRLFLEVSWEALEHAGIAPDSALRLRNRRLPRHLHVRFLHIVEVSRKFSCPSIDGHFLALARLTVSLRAAFPISSGCAARASRLIPLVPPRWLPSILRSKRFVAVNATSRWPVASI